MKGIIHVNLLTGTDLSSKAEGRRLLEIWSDMLPGFLPELYGNFEPLRASFPDDGLEKVLDRWDWPFLMKRKKPRMSGSVFMGSAKRQMHGWIHISFDGGKFDDHIVQFAKRVAIEFDAVFGFIHPMTKAEFQGKSFSRGVFTLHADAEIRTLRVTTRDLNESLPDLYFGTFFGRPYIDLFGASKLKSVSGCYSNEFLHNDLFYLQICEEISDVENDFARFDRLRENARLRLDSDAFWDRSLDSSHRYNTPTFSFR